MDDEFPTPGPIEREWKVGNETWTLQEFMEKLDYEGGITDMLMWGGSSKFPPALRWHAQQLLQLFNLIDTCLDDAMNPFEYALDDIEFGAPERTD